MSNSRLSEHYLALGRDLDVLEPKVPEDVYKSHLSDARQPQGAAVDSARQNLAATFVNAFVNAGFGTDKLVTVGGDGDAGADAGEFLFCVSVVVGCWLVFCASPITLTHTAHQHTPSPQNKT